MAFLLIVIVVLLISIVWTNYFGAPWVPTPMSVVHKMLTLAEVGPDDVVYDLGCGDGRTLVAAARRYGARAVGIELDPLRYLWCQALVTVLGLRDRVEIIYGDFFNQDLSAADVVTCYLLPVTNKKLRDKFVRELSPDTRLVSYYFDFPKFHLVHWDEDDRLYLYKIGP